MTALVTTKLAEAEQFARVLIYGQSGTGKTVFGGTAEDDPRSSPALYVSAEDGGLSISDRDIDTFVFSDYASDMKLLLGTIRAELADGTFPYRCIIWDSLSEITELAMKAVLSMEMKRAIEGNPEYADWNTWTNVMVGLFRSLKKLPIHQVFICLERVQNGMTYPKIQGNVLPDVAVQSFDIVGRMSVESEVDPGKPFRNQLLLRKTARYNAKDRTNKHGQLPPIMEMPTFAKLLDRLEQGQKLARSR